MLKKGTVITCPSCKDKVAVILRDCFSGEISDAKDFEFEKHQQINNHDLAKCRKCGADYIVQVLGSRTDIHTEGGWLSEPESN